MCAADPALAWLPARLRDVGYTAAALRQRLRINYPDDIGPINHPAACERLAADASAAAVLTRLFFLELAEPVRDVATALSADACEQLCRCAILRRQSDRVRARVRLDPVGDLYLLADRRFAGFDASGCRLGGADPVYPASSDSLILRGGLVVPSGARVLDLCTGSGLQALHCASTASRVCAVDINPRAVAMARLNAGVNGCAAVTVSEGNLYAPVRRQRFDVIVANPPFVSSPNEDGPSYHAGGPRGDRVLARITRGWAAHLAPGGRAFLITHVGLRAGETMESVAARWVQGFPGRVLVLVLESGEAVDLAAAQALFALDRGLDVYAQEVRRWVAYLRRHRIAAVSLVLLVAEHGAPPALEVVDAAPRILPIPLSPTPPARIATWLGVGAVEGAASTGASLE